MGNTKEELVKINLRNFGMPSLVDTVISYIRKLDKASWSLIQ